MNELRFVEKRLWGIWLPLEPVAEEKLGETLEVVSKTFSVLELAQLMHTNVDFLDRIWRRNQHGGRVLGLHGDDAVRRHIVGGYDSRYAQYRGYEDQGASEADSDPDPDSLTNCERHENRGMESESEDEWKAKRGGDGSAWTAEVVQVPTHRCCTDQDT